MTKNEQKMSSETNEKGDTNDIENLLPLLALENRTKDRDLYFDAIIGHIEDLIMDTDFQEHQAEFMEKYWHEFEDIDENKFVYMDIFKEYTDTIEKYIETHLVKRIQDFNMDEFLKTLQSMKDDISDELDGEIFEMLFTFTDFITFKQMFLDYKAMKEGKCVDFSKDIYVTSMSQFSDEECQA